MTRSLSLVCLAASLVMGCGSGSGSRPTAVPQQAHVTPAAPAGAGTPSADNPLALSAEPFGGERYGFVEATSGNGRYVALRRFVGEGEPQFGHHGEVAGGADLVLVDLTDLSERPFAEVIDVDPGRRYLLLLEGDAPVLLDSADGRFVRLPDADPRPDHNACIEPRQATFSPEGTRVGWVLSGASAFRVRQLDSEEEWTVAADTLIWRGWPEDEGRGVVLAQVPAGSTDWPSQNTSCACRWCNRFAASYGFYGWSGPAFAITRVDESGARTSAEVPQGERVWLAADASGCSITPAEGERGYARGPWRRVCP